MSTNRISTTINTVADRATEWLADRLADGPVPSYQLRAEAKGRFSKDAMARARFRLGVVITTSSEPGRPFVTFWSLPESDEPKEKQVPEETNYTWAEIQAYNQAWLEQQQGKQFYFTPPGGEPQKVWLGRLPVTRGNLKEWRLNEVDYPGIEVFDVNPNINDAKGGK